MFKTTRMKFDGKYIDYLTAGKYKIKFKAPRGYFVGPRFFSWIFRGYKFFLSWVFGGSKMFFWYGNFVIFSCWLHEKKVA